MIIFYYYTNGNKIEHNLKYSYIPDYSDYSKLIMGGSGSGKTNALLNLIEIQ